MNVVVAYPSVTLPDRSYWIASQSLGKGTYGNVCPCVWNNEIGYVAKVWHSVTNLVHMQSFVREVHFAQTTTPNPHILRPIAVVCPSPTTLGLVFPQCIADTDRITSLMYTRGVPWPILIQWAKEASEGLAHIHSQGWIHRDVKPQNLLVNMKTTRIQITDFGIARVLPKSIGGYSKWMAAHKACGDHEGAYGLTGRMCSLWTRPPEYELVEDMGKFHGPPNDVFSLGLTILMWTLGTYAYTSDPDDPDWKFFVEVWKDMGVPPEAEFPEIYHSEWKPFLQSYPSEVSKRAAFIVKFSSKRPDVPPQFFEIIWSMLRCHPRKRPTAVEVCESLATFRAAESTPPIRTVFKELPGKAYAIQTAMTLPAYIRVEPKRELLAAGKKILAGFYRASALPLQSVLWVGFAADVLRSVLAAAPSGILVKWLVFDAYVFALAAYSRAIDSVDESTFTGILKTPRPYALTSFILWALPSLSSSTTLERWYTAVSNATATKGKKAEKLDAITRTVESLLTSLT